MLGVAAFEIGDPMAVFIEMKTDDAPGSHGRNRLRLLRGAIRAGRELEFGGAGTREFGYDAGEFRSG